MRILHVVEPFSSGIITFVIHLTAELSEHDHIVLHGSRETEDNIYKVRKRFSEKVSFLNWKNAQRSINPLKDIMALFELIKILRTSSYDVIHLHSAKAGFLGRLACRLLHIKEVLYTPNSAPFARTDISHIQQRIFVLLEKIGARLSDKIITCGLSEYKLYSSEGIRSRYINNGIPIPEVTLKSQNDKEVICIGFAGIATEQKAPSLFSDIASHFINDQRVYFKWIGDGPLRDDIKASNIEVTGWLKSYLDVTTHLKDIDIFLSTSQWEGQPFAVIEAMRDSKCLLLFDCVGNRDLVTNGENGFLYKSKQEAIGRINDLLKDKSKLISMGTRSRELCVENHNIIETAKQYDLEYKELGKR